MSGWKISKKREVSAKKASVKSVLDREIIWYCKGSLRLSKNGITSMEPSSDKSAVGGAKFQR